MGLSAGKHGGGKRCAFGSSCEYASADDHRSAAPVRGDRRGNVSKGRREFLPDDPAENLCQRKQQFPGGTFSTGRSIGTGGALGSEPAGPYVPDRRGKRKLLCAQYGKDSGISAPV